MEDEEEDEVALPRKKPVDEEMDITPMIDITFLLLIFFVVASKMDPTQTGNIPKADNGLSVSAKDSAVIFVKVGSGDSALLSRIDGSEFSTDEETQTTEIVEYVTDQLDSGKNEVMLLGDMDVKVGDVTRIQQLIGDAFEDLSFTYIAVQEE